MPLSIENPEVEQLAQELAQWTGESVVEAILNSVRERLGRVASRRNRGELADELDEIAKRCASRP